jgi:hypothetical protein
MPGYEFRSSGQLILGIGVISLSLGAGMDASSGGIAGMTLLLELNI